MIYACNLSFHSSLSSAPFNRLHCSLHSFDDSAHFFRLSLPWMSFMFSKWVNALIMSHLLIGKATKLGIWDGKKLGIWEGKKLGIWEGNKLGIWEGKNCGSTTRKKPRRNQTCLNEMVRQMGWKINKTG